MKNNVLEQLKQEYNETLNRMQDLGDILAHCAEMDTSHCGQDADMDDACCQARNYNQPEGYTYKDLLGMEVVSVGGSKTRCVGCHQETDGCVKVELAGGDYICLAKPQEDERPVINFDEEDEQEDTTPNIMAEIKEKVDDLMDYLDSVVNG